jgi:hypothetical protein
MYELLYIGVECCVDYVSCDLCIGVEHFCPAFGIEGDYCCAVEDAGDALHYFGGRVDIQEVPGAIQRVAMSALPGWVH